MSKIYRAVSFQEKQDRDRVGYFRTTDHSLEAKQFFKSEEAVRNYIARAALQNFDPPYDYLLTITIDEEQLDQNQCNEMELDGYIAISIPEEYLPTFNNCVIFVEEELLLLS